MSFGFDFEEEDLDEDYKGDFGQSSDLLSEAISPKNVKADVTLPSQRHHLKDLLSSLPPRISYSKIDVALHDGHSVALYRRDLFDARFQLINDASGEASTKKAVTDGNKHNATSSPPPEIQINSKTDLIPGVYEGGFKTWECSLDLVAVVNDCFKEKGGVKWLREKSITEIGCGTALPSMFLLSQMIKSESECNCVMELCDFNEQVLRLVTLPNMFLTWYFSRGEMKPTGSNGEIELDPELVQSFEDALDKQKISIHFYSGSWQTLHTAGAFDNPNLDGSLVLTSETIYSLDSLPSLVETLGRACGHSLEARLEEIKIEVELESKESKHQHLCLVAAKMLYFGVGGGVEAFIREAKRHQATCKSTWHSQGGVARTVLEVKFH